MEQVGSRLNRGTDNRSLAVPEFSRSVIGDHVEFLNRIGTRGISNHVVRHLVVVQAIQQEIVGLFPVSVHVGSARSI